MTYITKTLEDGVTRGNVYLADPRQLYVDWSKNLSRGCVEPPVDDALIELAKDMAPKAGSGESEDGSSGQLNPVLVQIGTGGQPYKVVGGFRRMRAALWLVENGYPDFKIKYTISRMTDAEAALINLSENLQREDPNPIQMAHAIRSLNEDYGLSFKVIAGRLKKTPAYISRVVDLVSLPSAIQARVASKEIPVSAALELAKLPESEQAETVESLDGEKVTAAKVRAKREKIDHAGDGPRKRSVKDVRALLQSMIDKETIGSGIASTLLDWIDGTISDGSLATTWEWYFNNQDDDSADDISDDDEAISLPGHPNNYPKD